MNKLINVTKLIKKILIQSNLYKTTTLGTTQKWLFWTGGCLIKHLYKMTANQIWLLLAGF